jgi:membrane-associated phospholipid phosphatase
VGQPGEQANARDRRVLLIPLFHDSFIPLLAVLLQRSMKNIFRDNKHFLLPYLVFLLAGGIALLLNEKGKLHLFFNQFHHPAADTFFAFVTYLGDGYIVLIIAILSLFIKYRYAILIGGANIISACITQFLKQFVFSDVARPYKFFQNVHEIYLVPGVRMHSSFSFPSGHTTAAFTLYLCLALITPNKLLKGSLFLLSLIVAFSRVYLSQHFFNDIYAGSLIGVTVSLVMFYIIENSRRFQGQAWLNNALMKPRKGK